MEESNFIVTIVAAVVALVIILVIQYHIIRSAIVSAMKVDRDDFDLQAFKRRLELDNVLIALGADPVKMNTVNKEVLAEYEKLRAEIIRTEVYVVARKEKMSALESEFQQKAADQKKQ